MMKQCSSKPQYDIERFNNILEIGQLLVSTLDFNKVLTLVMEKIRDIFDAEVSSLLLMDSKTNQLTFQVALGSAGKKVKKFTLKKGEGFAGIVAEKGEPILVGNVQRDRRHYKKIDFSTDFETKSMMVAPLKVKNIIIGVIEVINKKKGQFQARDLELLMMLAPYAAIAIENAKYSKELEERVKQRTAELEAANKRLREIDMAKSEFLSSTAHELKTPLGAIKTFLTILYEHQLGPLNEEQSEVIKDCLDSIDRLLRLIKSLLDMARLEAGIIDIKPEKIDVELKLNEIIRLLNIEASAKKQTLVLTTEKGFVRADPDKFTQILINLIGNAIKYTQVGGEIQIVAERWDNKWKFSIIDNGPGMTKEEAESLFVRFHRLKDFSDRKISGTGLGLAISKKLVELQGGYIEVVSQPGQGSSFIFYLPEWKKTSVNGAVQ